MLTTIIIGVVSSTLAEVVTALNKRLQNTVLHGDAAFFVAMGMALVGACVKVFYVDGVPLPALTDLSTWQALAPAFTEVWTASQIYFLLISQKLGLDVGHAEVAIAPAPVSAAGI